MFMTAAVNDTCIGSKDADFLSVIYKWDDLIASYSYLLVHHCVIIVLGILLGVQCQSDMVQ
jgi:hypothetical protein